MKRHCFIIIKSSNINIQNTSFIKNQIYKLCKIGLLIQSRQQQEGLKFRLTLQLNKPE